MIILALSWLAVILNLAFVLLFWTKKNMELDELVSMAFCQALIIGAIVGAAIHVV